MVGIKGINAWYVPREVTVRADGRELRAAGRIDTLGKAEYSRHGGIMPYLLRPLVARG